MYAICRRYSGDEDEARDLLHDGFIKVFDKLYQHPAIANFDGWLRKVFTNNCLDYVRSAYKKYITYPADLGPLETASEDNFSQMDSQYLAQYSSDQLLAALAKLRPDYRVILNLYAVEGMNHQEISEVLGMKEATSRSKLMRARNSLKKILNPEKK